MCISRRRPGAGSWVRSGQYGAQQSRQRSVGVQPTASGQHHRDGLPLGQAVAAPAFGLGPVVKTLVQVRVARDGSDREIVRKERASAYRNALLLADALGAATVSFSARSVAWRAVEDWDVLAQVVLDTPLRNIAHVIHINDDAETSVETFARPEVSAAAVETVSTVASSPLRGIQAVSAVVVEESSGQSWFDRDGRRVVLSEEDVRRSIYDLSVDELAGRIVQLVAPDVPELGEIDAALTPVLGPGDSPLGSARGGGDLRAVWAASADLLAGLSSHEGYFTVAAHFDAGLGVRSEGGHLSLREFGEMVVSSPEWAAGLRPPGSVAPDVILVVCDSAAGSVGGGESSERSVQKAVYEAIQASERRRTGVGGWSGRVIAGRGAVDRLPGSLATSGAIIAKGGWSVREGDQYRDLAGISVGEALASLAASGLAITVTPYQETFIEQSPDGITHGGGQRTGRRVEGSEVLDQPALPDVRAVGPEPASVESAGLDPAVDALLDVLAGAPTKPARLALAELIGIGKQSRQPWVSPVRWAERRTVGRSEDLDRLRTVVGLAMRVYGADGLRPQPLPGGDENWRRCGLCQWRGWRQFGGWWTWCAWSGRLVMR